MDRRRTLAAYGGVSVVGLLFTIAFLEAGVHEVALGGPVAFDPYYAAVAGFGFLAIWTTLVGLGADPESLGLADRTG